MKKIPVDNFVESAASHESIKMAEHSGYSYIDMIINADIFVQIILGILLLASIYSWSIIITKHFQFRRINKEWSLLKKILHESNFKLGIIQSNNSKLISDLGGLGNIVLGIYNQIYSSQKNLDPMENKCIANYVSKELSDLLNDYEARLHWLGTITSSSPFIGLLGTVWGIMHSFQSIIHSQNSTISAVAPGIAESLFATALGLVVAIPALIFNNLYYNKLEKISSGLDECFETLVNKIEL